MSCQGYYKSGAKAGQPCTAPAKANGYCGRHKSQATLSRTKQTARQSPSPSYSYSYNPSPSFSYGYKDNVCKAYYASGLNAGQPCTATATSNGFCGRHQRQAETKQAKTKQKARPRQLPSYSRSDDDNTCTAYYASGVKAGQRCTAKATRNGCCGKHQAQSRQAKTKQKARRSSGDLKEQKEYEDVLKKAFEKKKDLEKQEKGRTRPKAGLCKTICDHSNRTYTRKKLPCYQQHKRRTGKGNGGTDDPEIRMTVWEMANGKCMMGKKYNPKCPGYIPSDGRFEIDHIQPYSRGGYDGLKNFGLICSNCNKKKGNRSMTKECTLGNKWICEAKDTTVDGFSKPVTVVKSDQSLMTVLCEGKSMVELFFFTTWCTACVAKKPEYSKRAKADKSRTFIAIDADRCTLAARVYNVEYLPTFKSTSKESCLNKLLK
jgi:hypothetical protein